jgi:hypothetical protein
MFPRNVFSQAWNLGASALGFLLAVAWYGGAFIATHGGSFVWGCAISAAIAAWSRLPERS